MEVRNDFKIVNVRVNKPAFKHIEENAPFIDNKTILKGSVAICCDFHIEMMIKDLDKKIDSTHSVVLSKERLALKMELTELWVTMKKGGYLFAYIMAEL